MTLPPGFGDQIRERAERNGRTLTDEVTALINAALAEERRPPRPADTPLERRIEFLLRSDPKLTRAAARKVAVAGGHDR